MRSSVVILDDVLDNPDEVREEVIRRGFDDEFFEGVVYNTVNSEYKPRVIFDKIAEVYGRNIDFKIAAFRQGKKGSPIHNLVHADNTCAQMAAVLYLNKPEDCLGGTAFWMHKNTGWFHQPTEEQIRASGYDSIEQFCKEWHVAESWAMQAFCGMRYNRIVIYPTSMFHSRWPWDGFGETEENARLVHCSFFDVL